MTTIKGIALIVAIIGMFVVLGLIVVKSDRREDSSRRALSTPPPTPMWTTITTYGSMCPSVEIENERLIKLCTRGANHDGECQYKIIDLGGSEKNDEELS